MRLHVHRCGGARARALCWCTAVCSAAGRSRQRFFPIAGVPIEVPDEAEPPLAALREAGFPILVVSGGHSEANEIICDTIARATGARRAVCPGRGHLVQDAPEFNALLESFLTSSA